MKIAINVNYILILSSILLFGCKKTEEERIEEIRERNAKLGWSPAMSSPDNYVCIGQHVYYFNKGKIIATAATLTDLGDDNWSKSSSARSSQDVKIFPDSIYVVYTGLNNKNQMYDYEGGMALPEKTIASLYKKGYVKDGEHVKFNDIIVGMAPGGRICVWLDHIEIKRGKVKEYNKFKDYPSFVSKDSTEICNYLKYFPVDYSFWEKPDPRYDLDFGFCSEDGKEYEFYGRINSKEGIINYFDEYYLDKTTWGKPCNIELEYEGHYYTQLNETKNFKGIQLPVYLRLGWKEEGGKLYSTQVVLPKNFSQRFTKPYINPKTGKKVNYNRLVFGLEKDGIHCIIWIDGPEKQEKLMRFKGNLANVISESEIKTGGYSTEITNY
ncbi:DUF2931 family protein [uncultured Flavobacterium sp.]|uniref:DUF2931 family protein n=1 Tax=uncultured Flavobacterium sp. TaxID=165435 RepID=UPI0025949073|nr:DUF2931 family protein [uncultured Flavobacterium sp.]